MATAKEFVDIALAEIGNGGDKYNAGGQPWCAIFVSWVAEQCGVLNNLLDKTAAAGMFAYWAKVNSKGTFHAKGSGYNPQTGDLYIENYDGSQWASHVGIVVEGNGSTFVSVSGNSTGGRVASSKALPTANYSFVTPNWTASGSKPKSKIFLNPGHGGSDPGADGNGYIEADLTREVVKGLEQSLTPYADITVGYYDKDLLTSTKTGDIDYRPYKYFLSIHFDAGGGNGTTAYKARNREANTVEKLLCEKVASAGGFANKGVHDHPNNLGVLRKSSKTQDGGTDSTLLEVCYIDNASDMEKYQSNKQSVIQAIADALIQGLSLTKSGGKSYMQANWVQKDIPNNPKALLNKTYERYQKITNKSTKAYEISHNAETKTHNTGLRVYNDDFLVLALGSYYGPSGTFLKIEFENGKTIYGIKGDEKDDRETNKEPPVHSYHIDSNTSYVDGRPTTCNLLEVQVDANVVGSQQQFLDAFDRYCGCTKESIKGIWVSENEPTWIYGGDGDGEKQYNFTDSNEKTPLNARIFNAPTYFVDENKSITMMVGSHDNTDVIGELQWQNSIDELSTVMSFSVPKTDTKYTNIYLPAIGDVVEYYTKGTEQYRGIIISVDDGDPERNVYTAVDAGWNLNKSIDTYQFSNIRADEAIRKILNDLCIPIVILPELPLTITEIFVDKVISDIIKDILSRCGKYNLDFVPSGIRIYRYGEIQANPQFRISENTRLIDSVPYMSNKSHSISIEELKNAVKVISDTDVLYRVQNGELCNTYGFLQEVIMIDPEKENAETVANTRLEELSVPGESLSFEIIETIDGYTRAGYGINVGEANYVITNTQHSIIDGIHKVSLDLRRI